MSQTELKIAVILSAYDKMSKPIGGAINKAQGQLNAFAKKANATAEKSFKSGQQLAAAGLAVAAPLKGIIEQYANLEDAQLSLKSTMMDANGKVLPIFDKLNKHAIELGNELPGNTADFYEMFNTMITNGAVADDILQGLGRSTAYLAVQLKLPYATAAEMSTRLKVATGVANQDMMAFNDELARLKQIGPNVDEMQYAFQRSAGELKAMKIQGLAAMRELNPVFGILVKTMGSGERVGTNFATVLSSFGDPKAIKNINAAAASLGISLKFTDTKTGDFLGTKNMMQQFDKLKNFTTNQKRMFVAALGGDKGTDTQILNTLINEGMAGYNDIIRKMKEQADLNTKVQSQLGSLKNKWDALVGTFQNAVAEIGAKMAPALKDLFDKLNNKIIPAVSLFVQKHPRLIMLLIKSAVLFSALALAGAYLAFVVAGVAKLFGLTARLAGFLLNPLRLLTIGKWKLFRAIVSLKNGFAQWGSLVVRVFNIVRAAALANPIVAIIAAIALAAYLIYKNWDAIKQFFIRLWDSIYKIFGPALEKIKAFIMNFTPLGWIIRLWSPISKFVKALFGFVWEIIKFHFRLIKYIIMNFTPLGWIIKHWEPIKKFFSALFSWIGEKFSAFGRFIAKAFLFVFGPFLQVGKIFLDAGKNIIDSLIKGITSGINKVTDVIKKITKKIRDFFPFSPAKEGALKDIHKIRLIETVAQNIKPASLTNALKKTTGLAFNFLNGGAKVPLQAVRANGGGVNFSLTVNLSGSATKSDAALLGNEMKKQFEQWMQQYKNNQARVGF